MEESIYQIAEKISKLYREACDEKILKLYKRVCRRYLCIYPSCIKFYIEAYREMWEDEKDCSAEYF